jgi:MT0933-like antitoxin protein
MPDFSKLLDRAKKLAGMHPDQVNKGVDQAEHVADEKTGGKHSSQIHEAGDRAEGYLGTQDQGPQDQGPQDQGPQGQGPQCQVPQGQGTGN